MTAKPVFLPLPAAHLEFWERFQRLAELRVRERNTAAGGHLWQIVTSSEAVPRFAVQSATDPAGSIECSFDMAHGTLTCTPGPGLEAGILRFRLVWGTADTLRRGGDDFLLEQVLTMIFDEVAAGQRSESPA